MKEREEPGFWRISLQNINPDNLWTPVMSKITAPSGDTSLLANPNLVSISIQQNIVTEGDERAIDIAVMQEALKVKLTEDVKEYVEQKMRLFVERIRSLGRGGIEQRYLLAGNDILQLVLSGKTPSIALNARQREVAKIAFAFGGASALNALRGEKTAIPPITISQEERDNLSEDEKDIVVNNASYLTWKTLNDLGVGLGENPFEPLVDMIRYGFVGPNFPKKKGKEIVEVKEFENSSRRKVIRMAA